MVERNTPTFNDLSLAMRRITEDASGYNSYPAQGHRVFNFQTTTARHMIRPIAEALGELESDSLTYPNKAFYDLELLEDQSRFIGLSQAVRRAPRFIEEV